MKDIQFNAEELIKNVQDFANSMNNIEVKNYIIVKIKDSTHELSQSEAHDLYLQLKKSLNITDNKDFAPYNPWIQPFGTPVPTTQPFPYDVWYSDKTNMINGPINLRTTGSMYKNNTNFKL